ncbi:hypothetical protein LXL04_003519 [Taraxacum kok-saghyz]
MFECFFAEFCPWKALELRELSRAWLISWGILGCNEENPRVLRCVVQVSGVLEGVQHAHGKQYSRGVESRGKQGISWEWCCPWMHEEREEGVRGFPNHFISMYRLCYVKFMKMKKKVDMHASLIKKVVQEMNDCFLSLFLKPEKEYLSSIVFFIHIMLMLSLPIHDLVLKVSVSVMLLRIIVRNEVYIRNPTLIMSESNIGNHTFIPKMFLTSSDKMIRFTLQRRQYALVPKFCLYCGIGPGSSANPFLARPVYIAKARSAHNPAASLAATAESLFAYVPGKLNNCTCKNFDETKKNKAGYLRSGFYPMEGMVDVTEMKGMVLSSRNPLIPPPAEAAREEGKSIRELILHASSDS